MYRVVLYDSFDEIMSFEFESYVCATSFIGNAIECATRKIYAFVERIENDV